MRYFRKIAELIRPKPRLALKDYFREDEHLVNAAVYTSKGEVMEPPDKTLAAIENLLISEKAFLAQMRSLGCQIALSSRLVELLKARGHPEIESALATVPIIFKRGSDPVRRMPELLVAGLPTTNEITGITDIAVDPSSSSKNGVG